MLNTDSQRRRSFPCSPVLISALCLPQWPIYSICVLHSPATAVIETRQSNMAAISNQITALFVFCFVFYYKEQSLDTEQGAGVGITLNLTHFLFKAYY